MQKNNKTKIQPFDAKDNHKQPTSDLTNTAFIWN